MNLKWLLLCFVITLVNSEKRKEKMHREKRLFSFNAVEDDVAIDLQFSIPFLRLPVKNTVNSVFGLTGLPTININPASLALGGAVVIGTGVLIPFFLKNFAQGGDYRYSRLLDNAEFAADPLIDLAQHMLTNRESFHGCPLRIACWTVQRNYAEPRDILNHVVSNRLLSTMVNSSAVEDAMISGRHGRDCAEYGPCPLQLEHFPILMQKFALFSNSQKVY